MTGKDVRQAGLGRMGGNQAGVVMLTTLLVMVIMAIIGIASVTMSTMENRMAGFLRTGESAVLAAESCLNVGVNVIQQTITYGTVPANFLQTPTPAGPPGTVPDTNVATLNAEIMGQLNNNPDVATAAPNIRMPDAVPGSTVGSFVVQGDIDRLYIQGKAGSGMAQFEGYGGTGTGAAGGGVDIFYQLDCRSSNAATGTTARVTAVYACTATGESCQTH